MRSQALALAFLASSSFGSRTSADEDPAILRAIHDFAAAEVDAREEQLAPLAEACRAAFTGRDWESVRRTLDAMDLAPTPETNASEEMRWSVVLLRDVALGGSALRADLLLELTLYETPDTPTTALPPTLEVGETTVGLHFASLRALDPQALADTLPERSRIREALQSWAVEATRATNPILDAIEIEVARVWKMGLGEVAPAYVLRFTFTRSAEESMRGAHLSCCSDVSASIVSKRIDPTSWRRSEFVPPSDLESLASDLRALLTSGELSHQVLVMRATRLAQRITRNRDWNDVEAALHRGGLTPFPTRDENRHTYLVANDAREAAKNLAMDFVLEFRTTKRVSKTLPTRSVVSWATAGFEIDVKQPFDALRKSEPFAPDTALGQAVRAAEDRDGAPSTPFLESISVRYRTLFDRRKIENPRGFAVSLRFSDGQPEPLRTATLSIEISSRLEPTGSIDSDVLDRDFRSSDTLESLTVRGASSGERTRPGPTTYFTLWRKGTPQDARTRHVSEPLETLHAMSRGDLRTAKSSTRRIDTVGAALFDDDLVEIAKLNELKSLDLSSSPGISDPGLAHLAELFALRELELSGENIAGTGFTHLRALTHLTTLSLSHAESLSDDGMRALGTLKALQTLQLLWSGSLTDAQLESLIALPTLRELSLWGSKRITDRSLAILSAIKPLESLTISHSTAIGSTGIEALANLPNLEELTIGHTTLDEPAIRSIAAVSSLEYVSLIGVPLTTSGLRSLLTLPKLKCLSTRECSGLDSADLEKLAAEVAAEFTLER